MARVRKAVKAFERELGRCEQRFAAIDSSRRFSSGGIHSVRDRWRKIGDKIRRVEATLTAGSISLPAHLALLGLLNALAFDIKEADRSIAFRAREARPLTRRLTRPFDKLAQAVAARRRPNVRLRKALHNCIQKSHRTPYAVASDAGHDPGYIYRLMIGERDTPSREFLEDIVKALEVGPGRVTDRDIEKLFAAAGYRR